MVAVAGKQSDRHSGIQAFQSKKKRERRKARHMEYRRKEIGKGEKKRDSTEGKKREKKRYRKIRGTERKRRWKRKEIWK